MHLAPSSETQSRRQGCSLWLILFISVKGTFICHLFNELDLIQPVSPIIHVPLIPADFSYLTIYTIWVLQYNISIEGENVFISSAAMRSSFLMKNKRCPLAESVKLKVRTVNCVFYPLSSGTDYKTTGTDCK